MAKAKAGSFMQAVETSATIIAIMFIVFYVNASLGGRMNLLGIVPRTQQGLIGIIFCPLLHYNLAHLVTNSISLFTLLVILYSDREYQADRTLIWIWFLSGIGTWLIGRYPAIHIGASSVIYGLVVYLIAAAYWMKSWRSLIIGVLTLFAYGGIFHGALPQRGFISWEGHLSGAISGLFVAMRTHRRG